MLIVLAVMAASATYEPREVMQRVPVSYASLDLRQRDDVKLLNFRVKQAIEKICRGDEIQKDTRLRDMKGCRHDILSRTRPLVSAAIIRARSSAIPE